MAMIFPINPVLQLEESESFNDEELSILAEEISQDTSFDFEDKADPLARSKTYDSKLLSTSTQFQQTNFSIEPLKRAKKKHMYRSRTFDESNKIKQKQGHNVTFKPLKLTKTKSFENHSINLFEASKSITSRSKSLSRRKSTKTLKLSVNQRRINAQKKKKRKLQKRHSMFVLAEDASPTVHKKRNSYLDSIIALSLSSGLKSDGIETDNYRVCELKDLIREIVGNDDTAETVRNALILCHSSFISSIDLFSEFRRYFRMELSDIIPLMFDYVDQQRTCQKFKDDWILFIRTKIAKTIIYWIRHFWNEDFLPNPDLQKEIEFFQNDMETILSKENR